MIGPTATWQEQHGGKHPEARRHAIEAWWDRISDESRAYWNRRVDEIEAAIANRE